MTTKPQGVMMTKPVVRPKAGPEADAAFFKDVEAVMAKHPEAAKKYSIRYIGAETEALKIDFGKQVGVSRLEGERLITEFIDRDTVQSEDGDPADLGGRFCCEWVRTETRLICVKICD
ncbi:hypothetical protein AB0D12_14505 [Streptomyces sp. NPDC048479]|uniref:hypothetical protein n=1 Tax=Streptomyces sp. NPDC048479 TaxID=3154725 RepID=UPI0034456FDE